ncbi:MAG TPA: metallophosphoesterase [Polyangiales bacterium]
MSSSFVPHTEPVFQELHAVSDLHFGGASDEQVFNQGPRLARFIDLLVGRPATSLALVLNGDVVDFLAVPKPGYLDPVGAIEKLEAVISHDAFSPVWEALQRYVASPSATGRERTLVIVLGNHDVELALPHVQHWLTDWLTAGDAAARGRIVWATQGAGFLARVGTRKVLCVHGNEVDDWNVVDHRALLQLIRGYQRSATYPAWSPNGGTSLVIDVMNPIKRDFPFIDLLKPETKAAIPILLGLRPSLAGRIGTAISAVSRRAWDGLRMSAGFLGEDEQGERPRPAEVLESALAGLTPAANPRGNSLDQLRSAQLRIDRGERVAQAARLAGDEFLGLSDWFAERPHEVLRAALRRWLGGDTTFQVDAPDDAFRLLSEQVGPEIHYLIAGHTHLRRALRRQWAGCYYYNTGTWIRLIQVQPSVLADAAQFKQLTDLLDKRKLADLDSAKAPDGEPLITLLPSVASVIERNGAVYGELNDVNPDGTLRAIQGTRFPAESTRG